MAPTLHITFLGQSSKVTVVLATPRPKLYDDSEVPHEIIHSSLLLFEKMQFKLAEIS